MTTTGLPQASQPAQVGAEPGGVRLVPVGVDGDDVERRPVDVLPQARRVGDLPAEPPPYGAGRLGEEVVDLPRDAGEGGHDLGGAGHDAVDPPVDVLAGQEARREQAQLTTGDEDDLRAPAPQVLRMPGALLEETQHRLGRLVAGERREPDLQPGLGRVPPGDGQPLRIVAGDAYGLAVETVGDDAHLPPYGLVVEPLT